MNFHYYYETKGSHVHVRLFVGGALTGRLVFRPIEWEEFKLRTSGLFMPEDDPSSGEFHQKEAWIDRTILKTGSG